MRKAPWRMRVCELRFGALAKDIPRRPHLALRYLREERDVLHVVLSIESSSCSGGASIATVTRYVPGLRMSYGLPARGGTDPLSLS